MRTKHYLIQTEKTYLLWIKRFILFSGKRHPKELGEQEVTAFLTHLAINRQITSSTQNLALCAIVFMYKHIFERELTLLPDAIRARAPHKFIHTYWVNMHRVLSALSAMIKINGLSAVLEICPTHFLFS